jgi:hypothetical protein
MNPWIIHVKQYALEHQISYKQALKESRPSYYNPKKEKYEKQLKKHNQEEDTFEKDLVKATNTKTKLHYGKIFNKLLKEKGIENAVEITKKLRDGTISIYSVASILKPYLPKGFQIVDQEKPKEFHLPPELSNIVQSFLKPTKLSKEAIDKIEQQNSIAMETYGLTTANGFVITTQDGFQIIQSGYDFQTQAGDVFEDNTEIELEGDSILDWTQIDPFSEGTA